MSTAGSAATLIQATKDLSNEWQQVRNYWHDVKSEEFGRKYIETLPANVAQATAAMQEIDLLIKKVRSDCE